MKPEQMTIGTEHGVIKVTLCAKDQSDMAALREELFNWYEDIVEREASFGRAVSTSHTSNPHFGNNKLDSGSTREADVKSGSELYDALKNLASAYIVLKSNDSLCGEVVQIPMSHEEYEHLLYKTRCYIDHVIQRYMGGYPF